jgi:hypothetical protein
VGDSTATVLPGSISTLPTRSSPCCEPVVISTWSACTCRPCAVQLGRHPFAQRAKAFAGGVLQRFARVVAQHRSVASAMACDREAVGRGQPAGQRDDAGPFGDLQDLADRRGFEPRGAAGQGPGHGQSPCLVRIEHPVDGRGGMQAVLSNTGSGLQAGVDQQRDLGAAQDHALRALLRSRSMAPRRRGASASSHHAAAQLVVDHAVHLGTVVVTGHQHLQAVALRRRSCTMPGRPS